MWLNFESSALQLADAREAELWFRNSAGILILFVELIAHCLFEELKNARSFAELLCEVLASSALGIKTRDRVGRASVSAGSDVGQGDFFEWFWDWKNEAWR